MSDETDIYQIPYLTDEDLVEDTPKVDKAQAERIDYLFSVNSGPEVVTELPDTAPEGTLLNYYVPDGGVDTTGAIWTMRYTPVTGGTPVDSLPWLCVGGGYAYGYQSTGEVEVDWRNDYEGDEQTTLRHTECPVPLAGYYRFDVGLFFRALDPDLGSYHMDFHVLQELYGTTGKLVPHLGASWRGQHYARTTAMGYEQSNNGQMGWGPGTFGRLQANMRPITYNHWGDDVPPWPADDTAVPVLKNPAYDNQGLYYYKTCYVGSMPWRVAGTVSGRALSSAYIAQHEENHAVYMEALAALKEAQAEE